MGKIKGISDVIWTTFKGVLILVILFVIVASFLIINAQGKLIWPFENQTELKLKCDMWNCKEPVPLDIMSGLNCSTIDQCILECKKTGALMLGCEK